MECQGENGLYELQVILTRMLMLCMDGPDIDCRRRHQKCDESQIFVPSQGRPSCYQCARRGEICEKSRQTTTKTLEPINDDFERRSILYFWEKIRFHSSAFYISDFFDSDALQASHANPAIMHCIVAVAARHESMEMGDSQSNERAALDSFAFKHYHHAINHLVRPKCKTDLTFEVMLTACLLMFFYDLLRFDYRAVAVHLHSGLRMMEERGLVSPTAIDKLAPGSLKDQVVRMLTLLSRAAAFVLDRSHRPGSELLLGTKVFSSKSSQVPLQSLESSTRLIVYTDYHLADGLYDWMAVFLENLARVHRITNETPTDCRSTNFVWLKPCIAIAFFAVVCKGHDTPDRAFINAARGPGLHQAVSPILFQAVPQFDELIFDAYLEHFQSIVSHSREMLDTFCKGHSSNAPIHASLNVLPPLFLTALKCRDSMIRRDAISLIQRSPPGICGTWDGATAATIAQAVVSVEEDGLQPVPVMGQIGPERRVRVFEVEKDIESDRIHVRYLRWPYYGNEDTSEAILYRSH